MTEVAQHNNTKAPAEPASQDELKNELYGVFTALQSKEEARKFLADLCTPAEIRTLSERWKVARLLDSTDLSYRDIHDQTGVSTTTIARVARFLREEPHQGYRALLDRLKD